MDRKRGRISALMSTRSEFIQVVLVAILISLGTNILSTAIVGFTGGGLITISILGLSIIVFSLCYALWRVWPSFNGESVFEGTIFAESSENKVVKVERYRFSEQFFYFIQGLTAENRALAKIWREKPFFDFPDVINGDGVFNIKSNESAKLAVEAAEYFVIDELSTHLTDYFNQDSESNEDKLVTFSRNDVPDLFIKNRFMDLFSRPMEEREVFEEPSRTLPFVGARVVSAYSPSGARFDNFDLTLPKGSSITRAGHGLLTIKTSRFTMTVKSELRYDSGHVPFEFYKYYLNREFNEIKNNIVIIKINVKFNILSFFSKKGWQYHRWVDSFLDKIENGMNFKKFLNRINWESTLTWAIVQGNMEKNFKIKIKDSLVRPRDEHEIKKGDSGKGVV